MLTEKQRAEKLGSDLFNTLPPDGMTHEEAIVQLLEEAFKEHRKDIVIELKGIIQDITEHVRTRLEQQARTA